jgi:K+/H+ antiporter YhaU regulatory subunit KhtT
VWLAAVFPYAALPGWGLVILAAAFISVAAVFWRRFVRWQSGFEIELKKHLSDSPFANGHPALNGWSNGNGHWRIHLAQFTIRENSQAVNRAIAELPLRQTFSCTIVSLDRQGVVIPNPGTATILYPHDKVLLLGQSDNLRRAESWLNADREAPHGEPQLADLSLEHLIVPPGSRHLGQSLDQLALHSRFGIQIIGIEREHRPLLNPGRSETLQSRDRLLVLGTPEQVTEMAFWLST